MNAKEIALKSKEIDDKENAIIGQRKQELQEWRTHFENEENRILKKYKGDKLKDEVKENIRSFLLHFLRFLKRGIYWDYDIIEEHYRFFFNDKNAEKYSYQFTLLALESFLEEVNRVKAEKEKKVRKWESRKSDILATTTEGKVYPASNQVLLLYKDNVTDLGLLLELVDTHRKKVESRISSKNKKLEQPKYNLSNFEWATIFYYAESANLIPGRKKSDKAKEFFKTHGLTCSEKSFLNNIYTATKRLNKDNNYPLEKLNGILPIVTEYYPLLVVKITNDIEFLRKEMTSNE